MGKGKLRFGFCLSGRRNWKKHTNNGNVIAQKSLVLSFLLSLSNSAPCKCTMESPVDHNDGLNSLRSRKAFARQNGGQYFHKGGNEGKEPSFQ